MADVSKRWSRVRETCGVEIDPGHDDVLLLAVMACVDQVSRED